MSRRRNLGMKNDVNIKDFLSYFGEYLSSASSSSDNKIKNIFEEDNISVSKSSSSSLSWGEDCEMEATEKVRYEYDKMNNVLNGLVPIPPHYDKDEYKLWIKTFPQLRLRKSPSNAKNSRSKCDILPNNTNKETVIDDLLSKVSYKLTNLSSETTVKGKVNWDKQKPVFKTEDYHWRKNNLEEDFQNFLRISPAPTYQKSSGLETRRRSTTLASNYMEGARNYFNTKDYTSLPHLPRPTDNYLNVGYKHLKIPKRKSTNRATKIVLPPIDVTTVNQFRSISAVPLHPFQQNKCCSALSTKTNVNFALGFGDPKIGGNADVSEKNKLKGLY